MSASTERLDAVTFENADVDDARNWSSARKNFVVFLVSMLTFAAYVDLFRSAMSYRRYILTSKFSDSIGALVLRYSYVPVALRGVPLA